MLGQAPILRQHRQPSPLKAEKQLQNLEQGLKLLSSSSLAPSDGHDSASLVIQEAVNLQIFDHNTDWQRDLWFVAGEMAVKSSTTAT